MSFYDRDLLGGRARPPDVDAIAYGEPNSAERLAEERAYASEMLAEAEDRLRRLRDRPDLYSAPAIARTEREVAAWRILAGDAAANRPTELGADEGLF